MSREYFAGKTYVSDTYGRDFMTATGSYLKGDIEPVVLTPVTPQRGINVITTLTDGYFYKPMNPKFAGAPVRVILFGGGGGGGGGIAAAAATAVSGGAGGGGGGRVEFVTTWDSLGIREWYSVGAGGTAGAAAAVGQPGIETTFGGAQYFAQPPAGISQWDQVPFTNSLSTLDPNAKSFGATLTGGDLTFSSTDKSWAKSITKLDTTNLTSVFVEFTVGVSNMTCLGLSDGTPPDDIPGETGGHSFGLLMNGAFRIGGSSNATTGINFTSGSRVGMVYNHVAKKVWYRVDNGMWNDSPPANPANPANPADPWAWDCAAFNPVNNEMYVIVYGWNGAVITVNFGGFGLPIIRAYSGGGGAAGSAAVSGGGGAAGASSGGGSGSGATAGVAGVNSGVAGGAGVAGPGSGNLCGGGGGGGGSIGNVGGKGGRADGGGPGGGAGGGKSATPAYTAGGGGGENSTGVIVKGGTPITDPGTGYLYGYKPGQPGPKGRLGSCGGGASGGGASSSGPGAGGVGGFPAGGGGGGGCSLSPNAAGAGGRGAQGLIIIAIGHEMGRR